MVFASSLDHGIWTPAFSYGLWLTFHLWSLGPSKVLGKRTSCFNSARGGDQSLLEATRLLVVERKQQGWHGPCSDAGVTSLLVAEDELSFQHLELSRTASAVSFSSRPCLVVWGSPPRSPVLWLFLQPLP